MTRYRTNVVKFRADYVYIVQVRWLFIFWLRVGNLAFLTREDAQDHIDNLNGVERSF